MRYAPILLPLAGLASAFVIPDAEIFSNLVPEQSQQRPTPAAPLEQHFSIENSADKVVAWWDSLLEHLPSRESLLYAAGDAIDFVSQGIENGKQTLSHVLDDELQLFSSETEEDESEADRPRHGHKPHRSNETIYELIKKSKYTTKFAKLIEDFPDIVKGLNSTHSWNLTLFVPTDKAFERIPDHGKDHKPPKEFVEALLKYHIGIGFYPAGRILHTHTIPTAYKESLLGGHHQRLRARVGLGGVRINFFSKVVGANFFAKNGVIHAVDHIIVPPPFVGRIISLVPQRFSTLLLAYEKTDFTNYIHKVPMAGATVFAPSNRAFDRLGPRANAFLFNTETGIKYLKAILKYHIVANQTLYSDAFYPSEHHEAASASSEDEEDDMVAEGGRHYHIDLPTLLDGKNVAVDVARWGGWFRVKVNGYIPVTVQDLPARNGVIQVVGRVLIPPHKHGKPGGDRVVDGEIEVEELKERLEAYVEADAAEEDMGEL
ncbi:uncharacterized protein PgNI_07246 [Pyricularia grisea]|uniref:FAS1 domain-containing protein n=1 Tax=Pyricularia grisea TaxID=148305 RepID=A0A6P8B000_PYRGI|nr:uncharacterized protein PgNI_07246 [Pyricularia grisea]TLD08230.1 hypothetical protein PgNI_07246 [Pyricularia grisea]